MHWNTTNTQLANRINSGNTFINGEVLTADALNGITQEMFINSDLMRIFFGPTLIEALLNGHTINWTRVRGQPRSTTFRINFQSQPVFVRVLVPANLNHLFTASVNPITNGIDITVNETPTLNNQNLNGTNIFHLDFDFYSDAARSNLIMRRNIRINYTVPPGQGID